MTLLMTLSDLWRSRQVL